MIERYCTPAMTAIWSREAKYRRWLEVEVAVCQGWAQEGVVPESDLGAIKAKAGFDLARCDEIEAVTRHDLMVRSRVSGGRPLSLGALRRHEL
jgi:adenylosuccinate lyase